jgi:hypothetical protein
MNFVFPYILNVIIPTDELIFFQRGRLKPAMRLEVVGISHQQLSCLRMGSSSAAARLKYQQGWTVGEIIHGC